METTLATSTIFLLVVALFLPTVVAMIRKHKNAMPIFLVNLLLGFTIIGWVAALIWSFSDNTKG